MARKKRPAFEPVASHCGDRSHSSPDGGGPQGTADSCKLHAAGSLSRLRLCSSGDYMLCEPGCGDLSALCVGVCAVATLIPRPLLPPAGEGEERARARGED